MYNHCGSVMLRRVNERGLFSEAPLFDDANVTQEGSQERATASSGNRQLHIRDVRERVIMRSWNPGLYFHKPPCENATAERPRIK